MFIQNWEEREERIRKARESLNTFPDYAHRIIPTSRELTVALNRIKPERGVYREEVAPPGETWFKVVTSKGEVGLVHLPDSLMDPMLQENLWKRLDAKDPVRHLKAI